MTGIYKTHSLSRIHTEWACLTTESYRLTDAEFRMEAMNYGRQIMAQARSHILKIIDNLEQAHYRWVDSESVYIKPEDDTLEWLESLFEAGIFLPVSLQAWILEVGRVNLTGTHPDWPKSGYVFDASARRNGVIYTDPLVVELPQDYLDYLYEEWSEEKIGPFVVDIAPDHITKANVSGGPPYTVPADRPRVESILNNERHCCSFTGYIRRAVYWRGFPGFDYVSPEEMGLRWRPDSDSLV